jgi:hypothetical protein
MEQHLKTIEQPFIIEIIDERFDNISTMLTDNAVVYGSSITSIISGLKAEGDLDIAVAHIEFMTLCKRFADSSKWEQIAGEKIRETDFSSKKMFKSPTSLTFRQSPYKPSYMRNKPSRSNSRGLTPPPTKRGKPANSYRNISNIVTFKTIGDRCVQIIQAKEATHDPLSDALSVVRAVDFVFCGVAIDKHGKIFEVIKSALDDCTNKVIRVANYHSKLKERFNKYVKRGWNLGISIDQAQENYLKRSKEENKNKQLTSGMHTKVEFDPKTGLVLLTFPNAMLKKMTQKTLHNFVMTTAKNMYGIYLQPLKKEQKSMIYIENIKRNGCNLTESLAYEIVGEIVKKFKAKFAPTKKKKFFATGNYSTAAEFETPSNRLPPKSGLSIAQYHKLTTEFAEEMVKPLIKTELAEKISKPYAKIKNPDTLISIPTEHATKKESVERRLREYNTSSLHSLKESNEAYPSHEALIKYSDKGLSDWDIKGKEVSSVYYTKYNTESQAIEVEKADVVDRSPRKKTNKAFSKWYAEKTKKGGTTNE